MRSRLHIRGSREGIVMLFKPIQYWKIAIKSREKFWPENLPAPKVPVDGVFAVGKGDSLKRRGLPRAAGVFELRGDGEEELLFVRAADELDIDGKTLGGTAHGQ